MTKSRPSKPAFDLPPVPTATRYVEKGGSSSTSYMDGWISDIIPSDFEEVTLSGDHQNFSRFFKSAERRQAIQLGDCLYIAESSRPSNTALVALDDGLYFTTQLAIASPSTLKLAMQNLRTGNTAQNTPNPAKLISGLVRLQSPNFILEALSYEQCFIQEIYSGQSWGRSLFSTLLWELRPPAELLTDWQRTLLKSDAPDEFDKGAALLFIGLFASRSLKQSVPALAQYANAVVPTGLAVAREGRRAWAETVMQEWITLHLSEVDTIPVRHEEEAKRAAQWLLEVIQTTESQRQTAAA